MTRSTRQPRQAFTLLEVILVVTLLVILASFSVPMFERIYGNMQVDAAADQIRSRWATARARSMNEARPYRFAVMPGTSQYRIAPARVEYWPGTDLPPTLGDIGESQVQPMDLTESLPEGITFNVSEGPDADSSGWVAMATFMPDGTCREDVRLTVGSPDEVPVVIQMRGLTGSVRTYRGEEPGVN